MEDFYDNIPVPYRTERIGRIQDLITQIRSDHARYEEIKQKIEANGGNHFDIEEIKKIAVWLKRDILAYRRLNYMSIEGTTCGYVNSNRPSFRMKIE